jgi:hypothetical protein
MLQVMPELNLLRALCIISSFSYNVSAQAICALNAFHLEPKAVFGNAYQ